MRVGWLTLLRGGESCVVLAILSCRWSDEFFSTGRDVRSSDTRLLFRGWDVKGVPHESQRVCGGLMGGIRSTTIEAMRMISFSAPNLKIAQPHSNFIK